MRKKLKKSFIPLMIFLVLIITLSAISAADAESINETASASDEIVLEETDNTLERSSDDPILNADGDGTFTDLNNNLTGKTEVTLESDYAYSADTDSAYVNGIAVDREITINGNGHKITGNDNRLFAISNTGSLILKNLVITSTYAGETQNDMLISNSGNLTFENVSFTVERALTKSSSSSYVDLYYNTIVNNANMLIKNSIFKDSTIKHETAFTSSNTKTYYYGLIYNNGASSNLEIENTTFDNNQLSSSLKIGSTITFATLIHNEKGTAKLNNVLISNNYVNYNPQSNPKNFKGFIYNNGGTLEILKSTIKDNVMEFSSTNTQRNGIVNSVEGSLTFNNNIIYDNTFENYEVEATGTYSLDNTYWGTNNPDFKKLTNNKIPDNYVILGFNPENGTTGEEKTFEITFTLNTTNAIVETLPNYNLTVNSKKLGETTVEISNGVGQYKYLPIIAGEDTITIDGVDYIINVTEAPAGTFTDLNNLIEENNEVNLYRDYTYTSSDSALKTGIPINKELIINGNGYTINSTTLAQLFNVETAGNLTLRNVILITDYAITSSASSKGNILNKGTILFDNVTFTSKRVSSGNGIASALYSEGTITIKNSAFVDSISNYTGTSTVMPYGLIYNKGTMTIENSLFKNNGVYSKGSMLSTQNGVFYNTKTLNMKNTTFENNFITYEGTGNSMINGIIYAATGTIASIDNCTFKENVVSSKSTGTGPTYIAFGTLCIKGGTVTVTNCDFIKNSAWTGSAIAATPSSTLTFTSENNTFIENSNNYEGANPEGGCGGAIYVNYRVIFNSINDKFISNSAVKGGAIYARTYVSGTTATPANVTVTNAIFEGNTATTGSAIYKSDKTTANNNYWGTNSPDFEVLLTNGTTSLTPDNHVVITIEGKPIVIPESKATFTVNFKTNDTDALVELPDYTVDLSATNRLSDDSVVIKKGTASFTYYSTADKITDTIIASVNTQQQAILVVTVEEDPTAFGTFRELNRLIQNATDVFDLLKDYTFDAEIDAGLENGIEIDKTLTINGHGFKINGTDLAKLFSVTSTGDLTLKDVILVSDYVATGSYTDVRPEASFKNLGILTLDNVIFTINQEVTSSANTFAAGIYNKNKLNIQNSKFIDSNINTTVIRALGLIDNDGGTLTIENTIFDNNSLIETTSSSNANGLIYNMGTLILTNVNVTNNFMKNPNYGLIRGYTNSQITVNNCIFENNTVKFEGSKTAEGGVIYISAGSATISNSKFTNNTGATTGGAISSSVAVTFINNTFERNTASSHGGAMKFASSSIFINNTFKYNEAGENGGALYGSSVTIQSSTSYPFTGNVFIGNKAKNGGAIYSGTIGSATSSSVTTVKNNTFINNTASENGGAIYTGSSAARLSNSVFIGNAAKLGSVLYSSSTSTSYTGKSVVEYSIIDNNIINDPTGTVFKYSPSSTANNNYWGTNNPTFDSLVSGNAPENFIIITIDGNETLVESDNYVINFVDSITNEIVTKLPDYNITVTSNINKVNPSSVVISEGNAIFTYLAENKGQDTIKVLYNGDEKASLNINVNVVDTPVFNITANDVTYGEELDLTFNLTKGPEGYDIYIWTIYDEENNPIESDYLDTASGKIVYAKEYAAGKYTIKVALKDVEGWEDLEVNDTFEVKQAETELTPVITVNEDNSVDIQVAVTSNGKTADAAGKINTTLDIVYEKNVENGIATIITNVLSSGTHNAVIAYSGDKNYTGSSKPITITIKNIVPEDALNLTGSNNTDKPTFSIKLPENAAGNLTVTIGDETISKKLENGQATVTFDDLTAGKHQATITYTGDDNYKPLTKTINITVTGTPSFSIVAEDVTYGEALNFTFTITSGPAGSNVYQWTISSKFGLAMESGFIDSETKEILYKKDYSAGNYTIVVSIKDVEGWEDLEVSDTFEIKQKETAINATIKINADNSLTITTSIEADGKLVNASGDMNTTIDKDYGQAVENGKATISTEVLSPKTYDITLIYSGDNNYKGATVTIPTTVKNIVPEDALNISGSNNTDKPTFSIKLPENATGNLTVTIGDETITKKLENGSATVTFEDLKPGNHAATVTYTGDENYNSITKETTVSIPKKEIPGGESALNMTTPEGSDSPSYTINLPPDATGNLTVTVDGKDTYTQALVNGSATVTVPKLSAGAHTITVSYSGDATYANISKTSNITVAQKTTPDTGKKTKKVASKIIAKKKTFKAKKKVKKYTITLKAGKKPIKKVQVTLKIKGKTYKAKTNAKGKATFKIKKLTKKGKYTAVIKFKGNKLYKATTKKVKITVKK